MFFTYGSQFEPTLGGVMVTWCHLLSNYTISYLHASDIATLAVHTQSLKYAALLGAGDQTCFLTNFKLPGDHLI